MRTRRLSFALGIVACLAALALWVSGRSFWIDECNAAVKAIQPDLRSFWSTFSGMKGSDFQMPLYMFLLWCWEKLVGHGEFALRSLNILFVWAAMLLVALRISLPRRFRLFWCLLAAVSPMLAAYMDEARPYALQFLASTLVLLGMSPEERVEDAEKWRIPLFASGVVLLCASSLTGVLFAFGPCLWLCVAIVRNRKLVPFVREHSVSIVLSLVFLVPLALFYLYTLFSGSRASGMGSPNGKTLAFCLYEFIGCMGVGPSRLALRRDAVAAVRPFLPAIIAFCLPMAFFLLSFLSKRDEDNRTDIRFPAASMFCAGLGILAMVMVGWTTGMRVLARHWMPALPVFLFIFAWIADSTWSWSAWNRIFFVMVLAAWACSSAILRFSVRHDKDDYRTAAAIARSHLQKGEIVWWAADGAALVVYGVPSEGLVKLMNPSEAALAMMPDPDVVVLSKPDVYDAGGTVKKHLLDANMEETASFPAFHVFERADKKHPFEEE